MPSDFDNMPDSEPTSAPDNNSWTPTQAARLKELEADKTVMKQLFSSVRERDAQFQKLEKRFCREARARLEDYRQSRRQPSLCGLKEKLVKVLIRDGFSQVHTPILMRRKLIEKMGVDRDHPLFSQIFQVDRDRCLRPMLAPHLYVVLQNLLRIWEHPVRIFEVGACFRKESRGKNHAEEFTMINIVEMGSSLKNRNKRLERLIDLVMETAGISDFRLEKTVSEVYGDTIDVLWHKKDVGEDNPMQENLELGSAAMGPHPLDGAFRIHADWIGIGLGLERLIMAAQNRAGLHRAGKSLHYLDGTCLSL